MRFSAPWAGVEVWYFSISWQGSCGCHNAESLAPPFYLCDRKVPQGTEMSPGRREGCLAGHVPDLPVWGPLSASQPAPWAGSQSCACRKVCSAEARFVEGTTEQQGEIQTVLAKCLPFLYLQLPH